METSDTYAHWLNGPCRCGGTHGGVNGGIGDLAPRPGIEQPVADAGLTLADLAAAKRLPAEFLSECGVAEVVSSPKRRCVDIPYADVAGTVLAVQKRLSLVKEPRFKWRKGDHPIPYGLNRVPQPGQPLVIVEGTSDCWTLWFHKIGALGIPGKDQWRSEYAATVEGRELFVWQEPGGEALIKAVAKDLPDARVITAPEDAKDPSALHSLDPETFVARMRALMEAARPERERLDMERQAAAEAALAEGRDLLEDPDLFDRIKGYIRASGYAGDPTPPVIVYMALTSRVLPRPMNLAVIAPSASGKNYAIDTVLSMFPPEAYVLMGASSPRALVYGEHDFQHRVVVVGEADSIPEDGPVASAIRDLAERNAMSYDVVERNPDTNRWETRHIEKPGPTGLITTATRSLREQLATRMLEVGITDSPEQTRRVLASYSEFANGAAVATDPAPFVAAQRWLALAGAREVFIPFSRVLAEKVPADLVRMRRDFRQLLSAIQAVALLHQRQRERNAAGRIVATLTDYELAREVLIDMFTATATGGISKAVRETVNATKNVLPTTLDATTTVAAIASTFEPPLHLRTAQERVKKAVRLGYLVNEETRTKQPARIRLGEPLPEDRPALPTVTEVRAALLHPIPTGNDAANGEIVSDHPETWPDDYRRWYEQTVAFAVGEGTELVAAEERARREIGDELRSVRLATEVAALPEEIRPWFAATIAYGINTGLAPVEAWQIGVMDVLDKFATQETHG